MKIKLLSILMTFLSINVYSQISFEKGYYIDSNDQKNNCLIKNLDWKNNPTEFEYKLSENSETKKGVIESIKEFGINNVSRYIKSSVNIDRSSDNIDQISSEMKPSFKEETLFLKVLVEGKANLYFYEDGNLNRFFYNKESTDIKQLVYKSYRASNNNIGKNKRFRNQLWSDLKCTNFEIKKVETLEYKKNELIRYFIDYNQCIGEEYVNYEEKQKKDLFNLNLRLGFNSSSLSIQNSILSSRDTDFGNKLTFRFGIEAEFILPYNKNKWSIITEPTYQYFNSAKELATRNVEADYKSIEFPIGIRHYFFLNDNSKIFVNGSYIVDISSNSLIIYEPGTDLEISTRNNYALGIGYKHNNRYSLELRYHTSRKVLSNQLTWTTDYQTMSVIFAYSIF